MIVLEAVELGRGRELNKIDALIKLIIFLVCVINCIKSFVGTLNQPITKRFPGVGGHLSP